MVLRNGPEKVGGIRGICRVDCGGRDVSKSRTERGSRGSGDEKVVEEVELRSVELRGEREHQVLQS